DRRIDDQGIDVEEEGGAKLPADQDADRPALLEDEETRVAGRRRDVDRKREIGGDARGSESRVRIRGAKGGDGENEQREATRHEDAPAGWGVTSESYSASRSDA